MTAFCYRKSKDLFFKKQDLDLFLGLWHLGFMSLCVIPLHFFLFLFPTFLFSLCRAGVFCLPSIFYTALMSFDTFETFFFFRFLHAFLIGFRADKGHFFSSAFSKGVVLLQG